MAFIPKDARWYLADLVLEHIVQGDRRNVVHINTLLIEANSPQRAYKKALALGRQAEMVYENSDGKKVRVIFRGLRELNVIHEPLEHGSELTYEYHESVPQGELASWVPPKKSLAAFRERRSGFETGEPNLMPASVMKMMLEAGFDRDDIEGRAKHRVGRDQKRGRRKVGGEKRGLKGRKEADRGSRPA